MAALEAAGVLVTDSPAKLGALLKQVSSIPSSCSVKKFTDPRVGQAMVDAKLV